MRLDKWLKVSRLIKRRTIANEACDNQLVIVNGRPARASYDVKVGDILELRFGAKMITVEVLVVSEHVSKVDSPAMYRQLSDGQKMLTYKRLLAGGRSFGAGCGKIY